VPEERGPIDAAYLFLLVALAGLAGDALTTWYVLAHGLGYEANGIAALGFRSFGYVDYLVVGHVLGGILAAAFTYGALRQDTWRSVYLVCLLATAVFFGFLAVHNLVVILG
jgi:hypothetical protein